MTFIFAVYMCIAEKKINEKSINSIGILVLNILNFPVAILRTGCVKSMMTKKYSRKGFIMAVKLHHTEIFGHISSLV